MPVKLNGEDWHSQSAWQYFTLSYNHVIALENIPDMDILAVINPDNNPRIFKSFTLRLGYLSDSSVALKVVSQMLASGGIF